MPNNNSSHLFTSLTTTKQCEFQTGTENNTTRYRNNAEYSKSTDDVKDMSLLLKCFSTVVRLMMRFNNAAFPHVLSFRPGCASTLRHYTLFS